MIINRETKTGNFSLGENFFLLSFMAEQEQLPPFIPDKTPEGSIYREDFQITSWCSEKESYIRSGGIIVHAALSHVLLAKPHLRNIFSIRCTSQKCRYIFNCVTINRHRSRTQEQKNGDKLRQIQNGKEKFLAQSSSRRWWRSIMK